MLHRVYPTHVIQQTSVMRQESATGVATLIQRCGSAETLNILPHAPVLNGVCQAGENGTPVFFDGPAPSWK